MCMNMLKTGDRVAFQLNNWARPGAGKIITISTHRIDDKLYKVFLDVSYINLWMREDELSLLITLCA